MPTPLANSWSCWRALEDGRDGRRSRACRAPRRSPTRARRPPRPRAPGATPRARSSRGAAWRGRPRTGRRRSAATPPESANAISFARVGDTVYAAALFSLSRTASSDRPMPVRRKCVTISDHDQQPRRSRSSSTPSFVGRRSPSRTDTIGGSRLAPNPVNDVLNRGLEDHVAAHGEREAERDDPEVEAADAERGDADHDRDTDAPERAERTSTGRKPELLPVVRGEVGADGDERELSERQLARPSGEHGRRHRDHQEDEHGRSSR